jgi:hypothetical protein
VRGDEGTEARRGERARCGSARGIGSFVRFIDAELIPNIYSNCKGKIWEFLPVFRVFGVPFNWSSAVATNFGVALIFLLLLVVLRKEAE